MNPPLNIIPVQPVGSHESVAFVNPPPPGTCGPTHVTVQDYPPSPCGEALRNTRLAFGLGVRDVTEILGVRPSQVSSLERGSATLTPDDWCRAWAALTADWRRRNLAGPRS